MIKIWFFWTPYLALRVLEDLFSSGDFQVSFVVTWEDKLVWRSQILTLTGVKIFALQNNIPVFTPTKIRNNTEFLNEISKYEVDYFIVVAYGKILPIEILNLPKKLCINVHWSVLPKYRWASPIQSALINWESVTWITIMQMSEWMDEWDIIDILPINIDQFDTTETLFDKFADVSWDFLIKTVLEYDIWNKKLIPQDDSKATYCKKITKENGLLDFNNSAENLFYLWKWFTPWPWIYTNFDNKKLIITKCDFINESFIWKTWEVIKWEFWVWIKCGTWVLILQEVKLEWKGSQNIKDFINWRKGFVWSVL